MKKSIFYRALRKILHVGKSACLDIRSDIRLLKLKNKTCGNKVRVGFIVQMPEIWDKQEAVYEELLKRDSTEVFMFVVPPFDNAKREVTKNYENNYFLNQYPSAIKAVDTKEKTIDLITYQLDYVFYQRPYDEYLPKQLRSYIVSAYSKCCYIPYGFSGADVFDEGNTNRAFFRNIYCTFMESSHMQKKLMRKYPISCRLGIRHIEDLGYPSLEPYFNKKSFDELKSILWTPRWSYDSKLGGSHFVEYKDMPFTILEKHKDLRCVFRPHPLMFGELRFKKMMTEAEIAEYISNAENCGIVYDTGTPIDAALDEADVLITDYSSIIIMYFLTGKPIIYCTSQIELNETFQKLSQYMYIAECEEDIYRYIDQLAQGEDYRKEERLKFISQEFAKHVNSSKRIADRIVFDATRKDSKG